MMKGEGPTWRDERPHLEHNLRENGYKFHPVALTWTKMLGNNEVTISDHLLDIVTQAMLAEMQRDVEHRARPVLTW